MSQVDTKVAEKVEQAVDTKVIDKLTDKSGQPPVVRVKDRVFGEKEVGDLLTEREKLAQERVAIEKERDDSKAEAKRVREVFRKIYSNPEEPDREALKEALVMAGKEPAEADALIEEELGPIESPADKPGKKGEKETPATKEGWQGEAWLRSEFAKAAEAAYEADAGLKKFVEVAKAQFEDEKEGVDAVEFRRAEILGGLATRADAILKQRIRDGGGEVITQFKADPVRFFREAMKQAAVDMGKVGRRRYGDPNRVGITPGGTSEDPVMAWLKKTEPKSKDLQRYDPEKTKAASDEFGDRLAHAILKGAYSKDGNKAGL